MTANASIHYDVLNHINVTILVDIAYLTTQKEMSVDVSVITCHTFLPQCYDVVPVLRELLFDVDDASARSDCVDLPSLQIPCFGANTLKFTPSNLHG